jgi:hypothetical protein
MRVFLFSVVLLVLFVSLLGCRSYHHRPRNVPSSAVWVDSTFIDCSAEEQFRADRCTVFKDDTGEVLAEGLFVLNTSDSAADASVLHYAAFGNGVIYLEDARTLVQVTASERDPNKRVITERLKTLAAGNGGEVIDCGKLATSGKTDGMSGCAKQAFKDGKPFYFRYYWRGVDSFGYSGLAGDANGNVFEVVYDSAGWPKLGAPNDLQLLDDGHTVVEPCPKPIVLLGDGRLSCARPVL